MRPAPVKLPRGTESVSILICRGNLERQMEFEAECDWQAAEPDVGLSEGCTVEYVYLPVKGGYRDVTDRLTGDELDRIGEQIMGWALERKAERRMGRFHE